MPNTNVPAKMNYVYPAFSIDNVILESFKEYTPGKNHSYNGDGYLHFQDDTSVSWVLQTHIQNFTKVPLYILDAHGNVDLIEPEQTCTPFPHINILTRVATRREDLHDVLKFGAKKARVKGRYILASTMIDLQGLYIPELNAVISTLNPHNSTIPKDLHPVWSTKINNVQIAHSPTKIKHVMDNGGYVCVYDPHKTLPPLYFINNGLLQDCIVDSDESYQAFITKHNKLLGDDVKTTGTPVIYFYYNEMVIDPNTGASSKVSRVHWIDVDKQLTDSNKISLVSPNGTSINLYLGTSASKVHFLYSEDKTRERNKYTQADLDAAIAKCKESIILKYETDIEKYKSQLRILESKERQAYAAENMFIMDYYNKDIDRAHSDIVDIQQRAHKEKLASMEHDRKEAHDRRKFEQEQELARLKRQEAEDDRTYSRIMNKIKHDQTVELHEQKVSQANTAHTLDLVKKYGPLLLAGGKILFDLTNTVIRNNAYNNNAGRSTGFGEFGKVAAPIAGMYMVNKLMAGTSPSNTKNILGTLCRMGSMCPGVPPIIKGGLTLLGAFLR